MSKKKNSAQRVTAEQVKESNKNTIIVIAVICALAVIAALIIIIPRLDLGGKKPSGNPSGTTVTTEDKALLEYVTPKYEYDTGEFGYDVLEDGTVAIKDYLGESKNVAIPSEIDGRDVTVIDRFAFYDTEFVENVYIPLTVVEIKDLAFAGVVVLNEICYEGSESQWKQVKIGTTGIGVILGATMVYESIDNN